MTNEQREAINRLRRGLDDIWFATLYSQEEMDKDIDTVLSLIKEQQEEIGMKDKQIDLMAEYINEIDVSEDICEGRTMCDEDCEKCIKQYFAGLVEKE